MSNPKNRPTNSQNNGSFNIFGKGLIGVLALSIIGGSAFAISRMNFNITAQGGTAQGGQGGQGGSVGGVKVIGDNATDSSTGGDVNQNNNNSSTATVPSPEATPSPAASAPTVDTSVQRTWNLTYTTYEIKDGKCSDKGQQSITVYQDERGNIGATNLSGSVISSGRVNLSVDTNGLMITLKSQQVDKSNPAEIVISGKTTAVGCPEGQFEIVNIN